MGRQGSSRATPKGLTEGCREVSLEKEGGLLLLMIVAHSDEKEAVVEEGVEWHSLRLRAPQ